MDTQVLKIVGEVAGIGGLALGVFLLLFKDLLKKIVAPQMTPRHWFRVVVLFMVLVWSVAVLGIGAWVYAGTHPSPQKVTPAEVQAGLVRETQDRIRRLRQGLALCKIPSTFFVADKIALVDRFINEVSALDVFVSPKYERYGFRAILSELTAASDKTARDDLSQVLAAFARLADESVMLRQYLSLYQETPNDQGGAEFLRKSDQQLTKVLKLLNELRAPWPKEVEPFPTQCR